MIGKCNFKDWRGDCDLSACGELRMGCSGEDNCILYQIYKMILNFNKCEK